jgi:hypothetical protein
MFSEKPYQFSSQLTRIGVSNLQEGLEPEVLGYWYMRIEENTAELTPLHLKEKIHIHQDKILWMKFKIDISKRVVPYALRAIEEYISVMPYSTRLYFRKVQQLLIDELNTELR